MQNQEIKETKDRKVVQIVLQDACYELPQGEEAPDALYDQIEKECKHQFQPYLSQEPQPGWWGRGVPKWYNSLRSYLTKDGKTEQKATIEEKLRDHLWGHYLNNQQKRKLQVDLQIIVWLLNDEVQFYKITSSQKEVLRSRLLEGIENCTHGFGIRVADVLSSILNPAKSINALITQIRHQLVDKALLIAEDKYSIQERGEVHTRNRFIRIASGNDPVDGPSLKLGVKEIFKDPYPPQTAVFSGEQGNKNIRDMLSETFKTYFTPFSIFYHLQVNLRNKLISQGYRGRLPGEDETYENAEYTHFLESLREFFKGINVPEELDQNPYFIFDDNYQIKDINWPFIRIQLWHILVKIEPGYFKTIPANTDFFDLFLQKQHKKIETSIFASDDLSLTEEVKEHKMSGERPAPEILSFPQQTPKSASPIHEILTDELASKIELANLEEYIYFIASFELDSHVSKALLLKGIQKNIIEKSSFPILEFLDLVFLTPPSSPLLNEKDTLEIIAFIDENLKDLFPVRAQTKVAQLRNKMLLKMIEIGFAQAAENLILNGAEISSSTHETLLMLASKYGHPQLIQEFLKLSYNTHINEANTQGMTALHYAAQRGHKEAVAFLLERKANIYCQDRQSMTALHYAAQYGHKETFFLLLHTAPEIFSLKNARQKNVLDFIFKNPFSLTEKETEILIDILKVEDYEAVMSKLIENGFANAAFKLINKGVKFDFKKFPDETPLTLAVKCGHKKMFAYCLKHYAQDIQMNRQSRDGLTILHSAIQKKNKELVLRLLSAGADPTLKDATQKTALDLIFDQKLFQNEDDIHLLISAVSPRYYNFLLSELVKKGYVHAVYFLILKGAEFDFFSEYA